MFKEILLGLGRAVKDADGRKAELTTRNLTLAMLKSITEL